MVFFWPYFILFLLDILEEPSFRDRAIWENDGLICMYDMREASTKSFAWFFLGLVVLVAYCLMGYEQLSPSFKLQRHLQKKS